MSTFKTIGSILLSFFVSAASAVCADLLGSIIGRTIFELINVDELSNVIGYILYAVIFVVRVIIFSCAAVGVCFLLKKVFKCYNKVTNIVACMAGACVLILCAAVDIDSVRSVMLYYVSYIMMFVRMGSNFKEETKTSPDSIHKNGESVVPSENKSLADELSFKKEVILNKEVDLFPTDLSKIGKPIEDIKKDSPVQAKRESGFSDIINSMGSTPKKKDKIKIILIVLLVISILTSGFLVFHYEQEKSILLQEQSSLEKEIASLKKKVRTLDDKADGYDQIVNALEKGNVGYAANYFKLNKGILYLSPGEKEKVTLTTAWSSGCTVYYENSSEKVASFTFNEDNWYDYTTITIGAKKEGVSIITLSNSVDSKKLRLIVVVD